MNFFISIRSFFLLHIYEPVGEFLNNIKWKKKIKKLIRTKSIKSLTKTQIHEIKQYYATWGIDNVTTIWHQFYSGSTEVFSAEYVPENLFYIKIEPFLNKKSYTAVLADKNLLDKLFPKTKQPESIIKNINGFFYANDRLIDMDNVIDLCNGSGELFVKPTLDTGGGRNVVKFTCDNGITDYEDKTLEQLLDQYKKDYIVQKKVEQHEKMSVLNSTSLNTFRVMSYLRNDEVIILSKIVRMGLKGSITDNSTTGGLSCGVQPNGQLNSIGYQLSGKSFSQTDNGDEFKNIQLPFMDKIEKTVKELHTNAPYFRIISWDLAIDKNEEVVFIEYNIKGQDITFHQLNNGPVLSSILENYRIAK